ncbi:MAG: DHH family phosphoesterase [Thermofilum sp.]|jgi:nanoRNase/pAp phosphatase (c-di-AMP/oligoRNAs hydrolase)|nr:DHH family phosphoesterase [Thermofilum sp.]
MEKIDLQEKLMKLENILENLREEVIVTSHVNCDPDGVACSYLMADFFRKKGVPVSVCFPGGVSKVAKNILKRAGFEWSEECPPQSNIFILCDFSNPLLLQQLAERLLTPGSRIIVIDHHFPPGLLAEKAALSFIEKEPSSTVLATKILMESGLIITKHLATLGIAGILYDTRKLQYVSVKTLQALLWLLQMGGDYKLAHESLSEDAMDRSEKIARIKGLLRSSVIEVCGYILAFTEVSTNEASISRLLISAGADIAIAIGGKREFRASIRVSDELQKLGVSAGELAGLIAEKISGEGGGHEGAAGVKRVRYEKGTARLVFLAAVDYISRKLCKKT